MKKNAMVESVGRLFAGKYNLWNTDTLDASDFWDTMDTIELKKEEIVLLTRYLIDFYRRGGYSSTADKFLMQANIEDEGELEVSLMDYHEMWWKGSTGMDLWTYFCHEVLLKRQKKDTFQTSTNEQPLNVDQDDGTVSIPRREAFRKISKYICDYFNKSVRLDSLLEIGEGSTRSRSRSESTQSTGSQKRKRGGQNVDD